MVSELDIGRCANEEAEPQREVDMRRCTSKMLGLKGSGFGGGLHRLEKGTSTSEDAGPRRGVNCEIPHRMGRTKYFL